MGFGGTKNAVTAYFKLGTNDMSSQIKLKRAYISWRGFSAGEMQTMLDGDACQPPTIDPEGPSGEVGTTTYQVSYKSPSIGGFQCAIGLEMPSYYSSNGIYKGHDYADYYNKQVISTDVEQMMPDIPAWIQISSRKETACGFRASSAASPTVISWPTNAATPSEAA